MSDFFTTFNPADHEDTYEPIPAGKYAAVITNTEAKATQKGGEYIKLTIEVIDGPSKGRKVFSNLNIKNANVEAEKIAKITVANICRAVGVAHPKAWSELCNKPIVVKLSVRPETADYPASNDVKSWEAINNNQPSLPTYQYQAPVADTNKKPWEK